MGWRLCWTGCASRLPSACSRLAFAHRTGRTALVSAISHLPLMVQRPLYGPAGEAVVVLLTPSGALFDGDTIQLEVECGPQTDVTLATASATKLNRCDTAEMQVAVQVGVAAGATFRYLPHELIPFGGTRYRQRLSVDVHESARAWLLEVISAGPSDARFAFSHLDFQTRVVSQQRVLTRERFSITPRAAEQMHGHTHYGSLLLHGSGLDAVDLNERLRCEAFVGASALPSGGVGLKALGHSSQRVRRTLLQAAELPGWLSALLPP